MGMENFEQPEEPQEKTSKESFILRHARGIAASVALATAGGVYVANEHDGHVGAEGQNQISQPIAINETLSDPSQYLAPRESIPLNAFFAADEYIEQYGISGEMPADPTVAEKMDNDMKEIAKTHGVTPIDLVQALRWKMLDDAQSK